MDQKEMYNEPLVTKHASLVDITAMVGTPVKTWEKPDSEEKSTNTEKTEDEGASGSDF